MAQHLRSPGVRHGLGNWSAAEYNSRRRTVVGVPMANTRKHPVNGKIKVGDRVWVPFGVQRLLAVVIEDRGHIDVGGGRLLRVRRPPRGFMPELCFEVSEA